MQINLIKHACYRWVSVLLPLMLFLFLGTSLFAAERPDIIHHTAQYLDRSLHVTLQWQSSNPVTLVRVSAGTNAKEINIDEYDNRRVPGGYTGETTVNIPIEATLNQKDVPYVLQLVDDLKLKSEVVTGKASLPAIAAAPGYGQGGYGGYGQGTPNQDTWGQDHLKPTPKSQGGAGDIVDKLVELKDKFDLAPSIGKIKVNQTVANNVSFSFKANDDKQLREINVRIFDQQGNLAQSQQLTGLGRVWEGTTQVFTLSGGSYRITAQAVDMTGNTSKEESAQFTVKGGQIDIPANQGSPASGTTAQTEATAQTETIQPDVTTPVTADQPVVATCPSGTSNCNGSCVDTRSDSSHCGGCGMVCPVGQVCSDSRCVVSCAAGKTNCSGNCVDLQTSLQHCGGCGNVCPADNLCVKGVCIKSTGTQLLQPPSDPVIYSNSNIAAVQSGPRLATTFTINESYKITWMYSYHYFNRGVKPGTISLVHIDGTTFGPYQATGAIGQGGVANAYWVIQPNVTIKPGTYRVVDSDPSSWSYNTGSRYAGFVEIRGIKGFGFAPVQQVEMISVELANAIKYAQEAKDSGKSMTDAARYLFQKGVKAGALAGKALQKVFGQPANEIGAVLKQAGYGAKEVASALYAVGVTSLDTIRGMLQGYGMGLTDIVTGLGSIPGATVEAIVNLLKGKGFSAGDLAVALHQGLGKTAEGVVQILLTAGYPLTAVADSLKSIGVGTAEKAAQVLRNAGVAAEAVAMQLKRLFSLGPEAILRIMKGVGVSAEEAVKIIGHLGIQGAETIARVLKGAGFAATESAVILYKLGVTSAEIMARALQAVGFPVDVVAGALKQALQLTGETIARVLVNTLGQTARNAAVYMKRLGYAPVEIAKGLKSIGRNAEEIAEGLYAAGVDGANDLAKVLKNAGFGSKQVAKGLKKVGKGATDIAKALKNAGWGGISDIYHALKDAGFSGYSTLKNALKAVGASATQIAKLLT